MQHRSFAQQLAATFVFSLVIGCQQYGEVSPQAYQFGKSLYSVCNLQDKVRLEEIRHSITSSREAAEITKFEENSLLAIVEQASADNWQAAMLDARTLMTEQVKD